MSTSPLKSISPAQLEEAIAAAVAALTGTATTVSIGGWKEAAGWGVAPIGSNRYELQIELSVGKAYEGSRVPEGVEFPKSVDENDPIDF